jgi:hypothetical protein
VQANDKNRAISHNSLKVRPLKDGSSSRKVAANHIEYSPPHTSRAASDLHTSKCKSHRNRTRNSSTSNKLTRELRPRAAMAEKEKLWALQPHWDQPAAKPNVDLACLERDLGVHSKKSKATWAKIRKKQKGWAKRNQAEPQDRFQNRQRPKNSR